VRRHVHGERRCHEMEAHVARLVDRRLVHNVVQQRVVGRQLVLGRIAHGRRVDHHVEDECLEIRPSDERIETILEQ